LNYIYGCHPGSDISFVFAVGASYIFLVNATNDVLQEGG